MDVVRICLVDGDLGLSLEKAVLQPKDFGPNFGWVRSVGEPWALVLEAVVVDGSGVCGVALLAEEQLGSLAVLASLLIVVTFAASRIVDGGLSHFGHGDCGLMG